MSRFQSQVVSAAAIAANTGFLWINAAATAGAKLRRITLGTIAGATTPTSQQLLVSVFRTTSAGTTPTAYTPTQLDPNSGPALCTVATAFATPPTNAATASWIIPFNTQSAVDLPWELLEEWILTKGTTNGFAFVNSTNAAPSGHSIAISIEHEE